MNRPYVICHMLASVDGKIDGTWFASEACAPALKAYGNLRSEFACQATLYGTTTMKGGYSEGVAGKLPHSDAEYQKEDYIADAAFGNYIVSMDSEGILGWKEGYIEKKKRPRAHVIEILTDMVSNDYLAYLRSHGLSYVFAGEKEIDCNVLLEKLYRYFHIERILLAGGGITNWSFAKEGLIDELSLVIAPVADGNSNAASIFETMHGVEGRKEFRLMECKTLEGSVVWLRYKMK